MIPHFQTQRKLPCLPCLPRFSPSSTSTSAVRTSSAVRKWKQTMRRRWERGWEFVLCHDKKKKYTARESNMSSRHSDSVLCPLAFYMSQTIFKNHQTRSHFHWRVSIRPQRCAATIIEFLCLGICTDEMWFPTLHSRCQKSLCVLLPFNWLIFPFIFVSTRNSKKSKGGQCMNRWVRKGKGYQGKAAFMITLEKMLTDSSGSFTNQIFVCSFSFPSPVHLPHLCLIVSTLVLIHRSNLPLYF